MKKVLLKIRKPSFKIEGAQVNILVLDLGKNLFETRSLTDRSVFMINSYVKVMLRKISGSCEDNIQNP